MSHGSAPADMLYELCPFCAGTATWQLPDGERPCEVCRTLRVIPVGLTMAQVDALRHDRDSLRQKIAALPAAIERRQLESMARAAVNCGANYGCCLAARWLSHIETEKRANESI